MDFKNPFAAAIFFAGNEQKSVLARDLGDCREYLGNVQSTFLLVYLPVK